MQLRWTPAFPGKRLAVAVAVLYQIHLQEGPTVTLLICYSHCACVSAFICLGYADMATELLSKNSDSTVVLYKSAIKNS